MLLVFGILVCTLCMGRTGMVVSAEEQADMQTFIIDAQMLPSDQFAYEIQLKVENQGRDWEGTVRLMMMEGDYVAYGGFNSCAYDTELTLPQGSTKQFTVRVPKDGMDRTDGVVQVSLLDKNEGKVAQKEFGQLFQTEVDAINMGILSDEYTSLTYLDMGGSEFYYNSRYFPIKLEELNQDNLEDSLDTLNFLVIDSYNTDALSDKALESIRQWMDNGGVLILGTGSSAVEVLAGFDNLEIKCPRVDNPGTGTYAFSDYVDVSQLHIAELVDASGIYEEGYDIFGLTRSCGNGAVEILPCSLAEVAQTNAAGDYEQQKSFVENMLWYVSIFSSPGYVSKNSNNYESMSSLQRICSLLGNGSNRLQFGGLKLIVILYVVFVGPVLYLVLRFAKKREFYWIAVPVTTLVGILLVYWAGRGFEVVSTNVYSVTIENLSDGGYARTYLRCYDAGHKEWNLRLAEGYEYVGPLVDGYYGGNNENYFYHIRKEGDRLFFGIDPSTGFEDSYFQAGIVREPEAGSIYSDLWVNGQQSISGTVVNETKRDFRYFAVSTGNHLFVYKSLPAGAEVKLEEAEVVFNDDSSRYRSNTYSFLWQVHDEMEKDLDILTALGMGLSQVNYLEDTDRIAIIGVTEDWDKVVDDNCSEVSYRCLYSVQ